MRYLDRAKPKIFLNLGLKSGANCGQVGLRPLWLLGLVGELVGASVGACAQIVPQHSKRVSFGYPSAIAFPRSLQISVLRGFLGGFFGFIGLACGFGRVRCFAWLVGALCV